MKLGDYVVTEAGFGADLGAEKFLRHQVPHGRASTPERRAWSSPPCAPSSTTAACPRRSSARRTSRPWRSRHAQPAPAMSSNMHEVFGMPVRRGHQPRSPRIPKAELDLVEAKCHELGRQRRPVRGLGARAARAAWPSPRRSCACATSPASSRYSLRARRHRARPSSAIATQASTTPTASTSRPPPHKQITQLEEQGFTNMPVCMAKTQYSFSDDANEAGRPRGLPHHGPLGEGLRRRWLHRCPHG